MSTIEIGGKDFKTAIFEVMRRSSADPDFRTQALKDGNSALKRVNSSLALPEGTVVQFHEKAATKPPALQMNFVLPRQAAGEELSMEELEQVAGGSVSATSIKITL